MTDISKIISRVQKLLAATKSDNEHEAALAGARAAAMIEEFQLTEAQLRVDDDTLPPEPIKEGVRLDEYAEWREKRVAWIETIHNAVALSLGCKTWIQRGEIMCFGRESATQAWRYTSMYLQREVARLCEEAWEREGDAAEAAGQSTRRWKNAFRVGAAQAIAIRLRTEHRKTREASRVTTAAADDVIRRTADEPTSQALAIVEKDEAEVEVEYKRMTKGWRNMGGIGGTSSRSGYSAGREAGEQVQISGGRGLRAGQGRLT